MMSAIITVALLFTTSCRVLARSDNQYNDQSQTGYGGYLPRCFWALT
jgi:hypothetical protein